MTYRVKNISQFLVFEVFCKGIEFPSVEGELFVTFDLVEQMSFLFDCEKYLISVFFVSVRLSETLIWSKGTLAFIADFGLRKVIL